MNSRACFLPSVSATVVIVSVFLMPVYTVSAQTDLDLIVEDSNTVIINSDYVLTGNILIKDNGVLLISYSNFRVLQAYDHQYSVTVEGNGRLIVLYSSLSSNARLNIVLRGNSSLFVETSSIIYSGNLSLLSTNSNSFILNSTLNNINVVFSGAGLTIKNTAMSNGLAIFDAKEVVLENSVFAGAMVTSGFLKMYDTRISNFTVTNEGKVEIYRSLTVRVRDKIGQEIPDANLDVYRNIEGNTTTLVAHGKTDANGNCNLTLLTETYDATLYEGSHFFGNYLLNVTSGSLNASATFTFEPYALAPGERKELWITINETVKGDALLYPSASDLHLVGNQRMIIENNSEIGFKLEGNLLLENNASLEITNSSVFLDSRIILLKENTTLCIKDSTIDSGAILYVQDKATLMLLNSSIQVKAILGFGGNLTLMGSVVNGDLYTQSTRILVENSELLGKTIEVRSTENVTISFQNVTLNATSFFALAQPEKFNFANVSAKTIEFHSPQPLRVYNLTYTNIHTDTGVEAYHFLEVHVTDGNNRSVPNATVNLARYEGSILKDVANGTTGADGKITFALLSRKITNSSALFVGNYRLSVSHKELSLNMSVALTTTKSVGAHFVHPVVPPFEIQILPNLPTRGYLNETITVSGTVFYNHGPEPVVNGSVQITIVETGECWNTTTDASGKFAIQINLPIKQGNYTVRIGCIEKEYGLLNETTAYIEVGPYTQTQSLWEQPPVVYGASTLVVILILGLILLVVRYINRRRTYHPLFPKYESELVKWAVETRHRSKER